MPTQETAQLLRSLAYASLAQSVEHAAVNRSVVGSSPTRGARSGNAAAIAAAFSFPSGPVNMGL